ncbi:metal-dependent hydrolase [Halomarina oriensis]|uniref:Metal-dependent hydrolase n=1 Tax=Halomarina oriensis TaxID=671145 RepID=A0A6B0GK86_9EURY|nr:metal-dependent hydrolase [Halomarina oriensis]MWG34227.1 metal-dependent hydrolase [Halomarina oriensis]
MPSLVVHVALAGLVGAALLGHRFDRRSILLILAVPIVPDLDAFGGFLVPGTHRALLHTLLIPLTGALLLYYDTRRREESWVRGRYGGRGVHVAWVAIVVYVFAGIGPDLFTTFGANPFYPLHDQFYVITGRLQYSTTVGWEQTFVELNPGAESGADASGGGGGSPAVDAGQRGSTKEVHVNTGIDPSRGREPADVERIFPIAQTGWQLLLVLTSAAVLTGTFVERRLTRRD